MQYFISFLEGIITFISPCLLPMLPIYISYFAGGQVQNTRKTLTNALGFVLGVLCQLCISLYGYKQARRPGFFNHIFCASAFAVPKCYQRIGILCHFFVPSHSCRPSVLLPISRKTPQQIVLFLCVSFAQRIRTRCPSAYYLYLLFFRNA